VTCNGANNHEYIHFRSRIQRPQLKLLAILLSKKMSSSRDLEEEGSPPGEEAFVKVNNYIKEVFEILKHETTKVRKERDAFDEVAKKLEHVHFSKLVKLNVGGHLFSTSLETVNKDPGMF